MSIEFILTLIFLGLIAYNHFHLVRRLQATEKSLQSVRRQLVANRQATPDERPIIRNRELTKLGRDIDSGTPVNDELQIID